MIHAAIVEVSFDLLHQWLHLPLSVKIDAVALGHSNTFRVRMRSTDDFLPEVPEGERATLGTITVSLHEPTVEFRAYD